jgi:molybdopterin converting factor small subunit
MASYIFLTIYTIINIEAIVNRIWLLIIIPNSIEYSIMILLIIYVSRINMMIQRMLTRRSNGSIGYFPTYTIGTIVAAQIREAMERDLEDLAGYTSGKSLSTIKEWLKAKIHRWGATYPPKQLIKMAIGIDIEPTSYITYLQKKYIEKKNLFKAFRMITRNFFNT